MAISYSVNRSAPTCPTQLDGTRLEAPVPPPRRWYAVRPAEVSGFQPEGAMLGAPGPDAGYAFLLFERVRKRLVALAGESADDVKTAITASALRRASRRGRGPMIGDLDWAARYWGMIGEDGKPDQNPPSGLDPHQRAALFAGCAHDYALQRQVAGHPAEAELGD